MGDATSKTEKKLLDKEIDVDVIKVGHHGSSYSTIDEFLNKVSPKYAIIQVGENNKYNHPAESVIEIFKKIGSSIYRTDLNGDIIIYSYKDKIVVEKEK